MSATMSTLSDALERLAPLGYAEDWDNVGLLIGSPEQVLSGPVLLTIDLSERVADEAVTLGCSAIIAYHPPIFKPIRRLTARSAGERALLKVVRAGMGVYSPHTALDAAPNGMTDWLADGLLDRTGQIRADRRALKPWVGSPETEEVKVVTFVPENRCAELRNALATAGAGRIGRYEVCSFAVAGTGTFLGGEGTRPAIGTPHTLESVEEMRLEMVCSRRSLALAMTIIRQFHPYEEPAVDVYPLVGKPTRAIGAGRRLVLDQPSSLRKLADRLKSHLGVPSVKVAPGPGHTLDRRVQCIGACPGAGAELAPLALAEGCEVFVTGEMKYHECLPMLDAGLSIILAGHTNTERGYLPRLAEHLRNESPDLQVRISTEDASPFTML